ncbi:MAG: C25 family cysteine peptidase [Thermoplasmatota archaeon]
MKKNDKIIVVLGVIILILASIGIYFWAPEEIGAKTANINEFISITGNLKYLPDYITVSDKDPFYPLIATPLAVNYDKNGEQTIIPLYVMNIENPSQAIKNVQDLINSVRKDEIIKDDESAKNASLRLAQKYWENSEAALIIEYNQSGYNLGVIATPLASYLRIPVIVTEKIDSEVTNILNELDVKKTIVIGENIQGFGNVIRFTTIDDIINVSIQIVQDKFKQEIDYITITNPIDAWPPAVLDSVSYSFGPMTIPSGSSTFLGQAITKGGYNILGTFKIPKDYDYALIKFEGINLDYKNVDNFGDYVTFRVGANLDDIPSELKITEAISVSTSTGGVGERDKNGNLIRDVVYSESVLYGRGGVEYTIRCKGQWLLNRYGNVAANVVIEKLENPVYPMMKNISSLAPYLTAYHKGIIFGKPEFAFTVDDNILTEQGEKSPGFYMPRKNPRIVYKSNAHIYDVIHKPLNELLARLAGITLKDDRDLKVLRDHYAESPVYIALVGGATVIPNYIYQNYVEPVDYWEGQYSWGVGTPSDVIYGDIDPLPYVWDNIANDIFSQYPYQENIVGRITGWDAQDACALILRSIFYNEIIKNMEAWKNSFTILVGAGQDFRQPLIRFPIAKIFGAAYPGEPMKMWTGYGEFSIKATIEKLAKPLGFRYIYQAFAEKAQREGFSNEDLKKIKYETNMINKLFFRVPFMEKIIGDNYVVGGELMKKSNFIFVNGHGNMAILAMDGIDLTAAGFGGPVIQFILKKILEVVSPYTGPGASLASHGQYNTREVPVMDLGPSFMWLESCICGKIDGMYPQNSLGQAFLHAGLAALIASPTGSNIAGGYLEPKNFKWDTPLSVLKAYIKTKLNARKGIYPDQHFGFLIYNDLCFEIKKDGDTIGRAFRDAKNKYLPQDASWKLWWSPPLIKTGDYLEDIKIFNTYYDRMKNQALEDPYMLKNKYTTFQEYMLFGDPALKLYIPD